MSKIFGWCRAIGQDPELQTRFKTIFVSKRKIINTDPASLSLIRNNLSLINFFMQATPKNQKTAYEKKKNKTAYEKK